MKPRAPRAYAVVYYTDGASSWPRDLGDDPAFGAHLDGKGEVTWGVCRPDVRNALANGDLVVFFATIGAPSKRKPSPYWFVGFATVDQKISQAAIWKTKRNARFRVYSNLLIRPRRGDRSAFEHHEPDPMQNHSDWLWRLVHDTGHGKKKAAYARLAKAGIIRPGIDKKPGGGQLMLAENYVLFSSASHLTRVLKQPWVVASAREPGVAERWRPGFGLLRTLLFPRGATRRSLRTSNPRNGAHRHVVLGNVEVVRAALIAMLKVPHLLETKKKRGPASKDARPPQRRRPCC